MRASGWFRALNELPGVATCTPDNPIEPHEYLVRSTLTVRNFTTGTEERLVTFDYFDDVRRVEEIISGAAVRDS